VRIPQQPDHRVTDHAGTDLLTRLECCSILYQRGIYPPDNFEQRKQYGLSIMVSTDTGLTDYLSTVLEQMSGMLLYMPKQTSYLPQR